MPPAIPTWSVSSRIRSLYFAVKLRRFGAPVNSAAGPAGADTTRAAVAVEAGPSGEEGKAEGRRSRITIGSSFCALEGKLPRVECLTLVGTEGIARALLHNSV